MPGGEVLTLIDALRAAGIEFILTKHENSAGFMAEGAHHIDGAPAILVATVGPGLMNAVNVVANAEQDRVPMIVLAGAIDADDALTYTHQAIDHRAVLRPITRATFTLTADGAGVIADKALAMATEARPGPVLIDVPVAVADAPSAQASIRRAAPAPVVPAPPDLGVAQGWAATAERPIILAGLDILTEGSEASLRAAAEQLKAPVITTYKAKGVLPESHPLSLGAAGLSPLADKALVPLVQSADLVICAGYDPIEMRPGWRNVWDPARQRVIDIHAAPNHHYMHHATLSFVGHTGATLKAICAEVPERETVKDTRIEGARDALRAAFPDTQDWGPAAIIAEVRAGLPPEAIATVDSGAHRILLSQMWQCPEPRTLLQSSGLCTMGCALPLSMGVKIAAPDRPVVAFAGDAGALMVAGELSTAAELNLPVILIVFVDASLGLIEMKQRQRHQANAGVDFGHHDFAALAGAFGGYGMKVDNRSDLRVALETALKENRFSIIAAEIDRRAYDGRI
jgi:acetolactate synthase-1/2/3 large subunit